jgi:hypothetical protein
MKMVVIMDVAVLDKACGFGYKILQFVSPDGSCYVSYVWQ